MIDQAVKATLYNRRNQPQYQGELERQLARIKQYKEWKDKHVMHKKDRVVKVGDKVDVRDTEHIWCVGQVELKISTANRVPLLYIHYEVRGISTDD